MPDACARQALVISIEAFLEGKIDNWAFDDAIFRLKTKDELVIQIRRQIWYFYCDVRRYFNTDQSALTEERAIILHRWTALLSSAIEWQDLCNTPQHGWHASWRRFWEVRFSKPLFKSNPYWPLQKEHARADLRLNASGLINPASH